MGKKIFIMGDICPDNDYRKIFDKGEIAVSDKILDLINQSEIAIANLECPATYEEKPITKCGPSLKANPEDIELLKKYGFGILTLANNHILDYGEEGVLETLNKCNEVGIKTFGAGRNNKDATKPMIIDICDKRIGLISFAEEEFNLASEKSPGANHFDVYQSFEDIASLKYLVDHIIVFYHGGIEHYAYPSPLLQKKCRKMIDAGADLVLCQHSHCIGTYENYKTGRIVYGQGNSICGYRKGDDSWNEGFIISVDIETFEADFMLINATPNGIILADKMESNKRFIKMEKQSEYLQDSEWIQNRWQEFVDSKRTMYYSLLFGKNRIFNKLNKIFGNKLIDLFYGRKTQMITMNLIRCESHNEFITTMLEGKVYGK